MTTTTQLLGRVYLLTPGARVHAVITAARELSSNDPDQLDVVLSELARSDSNARRLSILMADVSGRSAHLAALLTDPDVSVATMATGARSLSDNALTSLLETGSLRMRRLAYRRIRRLKQSSVAAYALPAVRERWGDREAAAILAACDRETVTRYLPELAYAVGSWTPLVARHAEVVSDYAQSQLGPLTGYAAHEWWAQNASLVTALAKARPAIALDLAEQLAEHLPDGGLPPELAPLITHLLRADAARTARLMLAQPQGLTGRRRGPLLTRSSATRLAGLDDELVGRLLQVFKDDATPAFRQLLRAVPPSRRSVVFDRAHGGTVTGGQVGGGQVGGGQVIGGTVAAGTVLATAELDLLPRSRRYDEVRRMLPLPTIAGIPAHVREYTAFLPFDEAQPILRAGAASADAGERMVAYQEIIRNAGREGTPEQVAEALSWLVRTRNERDPVRNIVLLRIAQLPFRALTPAAVPPLDQLVRDALDARDLSSSSSRAIGQLAMRTLWHSATQPGDDALGEWALRIVAQLSAWGPDSLQFGREALQGLPRGAEHRIWTFLRTSMKAYLDRQNPMPFLRMMTALGTRAENLPEAQELLGEATRTGTDASVSAAIGLWLKPRAGRAFKVAQLVSHDPSTVKRPAVFQTLVTIRTDLLEDLVLLGEPLPGRFTTGDAVWVPIVSPVLVRRWNPLQQALYQSLLVTALADRQASRFSRGSYVRALAATPGGGVDAADSFIADPDVRAAEAALTGLGRSDRPIDALPVLLAELSGPRARVAVYAASRCASFLAPDALASLLAPLLISAPKVVARKEIARLLALTRPPGALEALLAVWYRDGEHRDVRIAAALSLIPYISDPRVQAVLADAARNTDPHIARAIAKIPRGQVPPPLRPVAGRLVGAVTAHADPGTAAQALAALPAWFAWVPETATAIGDRLADLDEPTGWLAAARAGADPAVWTRNPQLPATLAAALIARIEEGPDAGPTRDQPARRRLEDFVDLFTGHDREIRQEPEAALALSAELASHHVLHERAARLLVTLATAVDQPGPNDKNTRDGAQLNATPVLAAAQLLSGRPVAASAVSACLPDQNWNTPQAIDLTDRLIDRGDAASGLFAVAITAAAGRASDWLPEWAQRLRTLRAHREGDVADAALAVLVTPRE